MRANDQLAVNSDKPVRDCVLNKSAEKWVKYLSSCLPFFADFLSGKVPVELRLFSRFHGYPKVFGSVLRWKACRNPAARLGITAGFNQSCFRSSCCCIPDRNRASPGDSESDRFQANPLAFLEATYGRGPGTGDPYSPPPDLAVMYSTHFDSPGVSSFLSSLGLERAEVVFNAHVNGDADSADTHHGVVVLERTSCLS